jgi:GTPase Era involved in 16S rRNA processing
MMAKLWAPSIPSRAQRGNHSIFPAEIPYEIRIEANSLEEQANRLIKIEIELVVPTNVVRGIVLGSRGAAIDSVAKAARIELSSMWNREVDLHLQVRVAKQK